MYQINDNLRVHWWIFDFLHWKKSGKTVVHVVNKLAQLSTLIWNHILHILIDFWKKFPPTFLFSATFLLIFKKISLLHFYLVLLFYSFPEKVRSYTPIQAYCYIRNSRVWQKWAKFFFFQFLTFLLIQFLMQIDGVRFCCSNLALGLFVTQILDLTF